MKTLIALTLALSPLFSLSSQACDMPQGFHEFMTFGQNSVYLSHYPMFGSVHSYQIVLKAELTVNGQSVTDQFLALQKANPNVAYSTSPIRSNGEDEYAVLVDYAQVGTKFHAHIHADQKPDAFKDVVVEIKQVILNRLMNQPKVDEAKPSALNYFYFGDANEAYLIHQMFWNPDFDQIVQVKPIAPTQCAGAVSLSERTNSEKDRLLSRQSATAVNSCNESFAITPIKEIYEDKMTIQH